MILSVSLATYNEAYWVRLKARIGSVQGGYRILSVCHFSRLIFFSGINSRRQSDKYKK